MKRLLSLFALLVSILSVHAEATIGYLLTESDKYAFPEENIDGIAQKPEYHAAEWFEQNYIQTGKGTFISLTEVTTADLRTLKAIWVNVDRVGLSNLAAAGINNEVVAALKQYVANGGNLFVTKQANQIIYQIGRIGYAPTWESNAYVAGNDVWHINPHLCIHPTMGGEIDCSTHPIYTDLYTQTRSFEHNGVYHEYSAYPLVGEITRTNNNNMWVDMFRKDPTTGGQMAAKEGYTHYNNLDKRRLTDFEADWNCKVLAVWGQVLDACSPGLIIFNPTEDFKGQIISCGFAAYQWGTNNDMIANVRQLSANALAILTGEEPGKTIPTDSVVSSGDRIFYMDMELEGKYTKEKVSDQYVRVPCTASDPIVVDGVKGKAIRTDGYSTYMNIELDDTHIPRI